MKTFSSRYKCFVLCTKMCNINIRRLKTFWFILLLFRIRFSTVWLISNSLFFVERCELKRVIEVVRYRSYFCCGVLRGWLRPWADRFEVVFWRPLHYNIAPRAVFPVLLVLILLLEGESRERNKKRTKRPDVRLSRTRVPHDVVYGLTVCEYIHHKTPWLSYLRPSPRLSKDAAEESTQIKMEKHN